MVWNKMVADKMVWAKWYTDKMVLDKMIWTKWYANGQNGTDKIDRGNLKGLKWKWNWGKNHIVSESGIDRLIDDFIGTVSSLPFCPLPQTILSATTFPPTTPMH